MIMGKHVAVDWGSSNFRAWLFDGDRVLEARQVPDGGILQVAEGGYEQALRDRLGDWLQYTDRVVLAGMVTSRNGWVETPYLACPTSVTALHLQATQRSFPGMDCRFLPGICQNTPQPDVMRGEELQILGAMAGAGLETVVLPGTHSKWAIVRDRVVQGFGTWLTGELYALVRYKSLAGRLGVEADWDPDAFAAGLDAAAGPSPMASIFAARSSVLLSRMAPAAVGDYLSGLMIGCEVREALARDLVAGTVTLVAPPALLGRYEAALARFGIGPPRLVSDATQRGFARLVGDCAPVPDVS